MNEYMNNLARGQSKRTRQIIRKANLPESVKVTDREAEKEIDLYLKTKTQQYIRDNKEQFEKDKRDYLIFLKQHRLV